MPNTNVPTNTPKGEMSSTANSTKAAPRFSKSGKRLTPAMWKPGQSGNPKGRPKEGQSWAAVWKELTNATAGELGEAFTDSKLGQTFKKLPQGVQMKYLVGARCLAQLMSDPQSAMLNIIMDREDGRVTEKLETQSTLNIEGLDNILDRVYGPDGEWARTHKPDGSSR